MKIEIFGQDGIVSNLGKYAKKGYRKPKGERKIKLVNCDFCGKEFWKYNCRIKRIKNIYCNVSCKTKHMGIINKGKLIGEKHPGYGKVGYWKEKKFSKEHIKNQRASRRKNGWFKDLDEFKKKQSINTKGKNNPMYDVHRYGKNSPRWQGGLSFEPYGLDFNKQFKEMIKDRDNYTCQLCKKQKPEVKRFHVHHINYIKTDNFTFNCITLCNSCHSITNSNRTYWTNFFQDYLRDKYGYTFNLRQEKMVGETK